MPDYSSFKPTRTLSAPSNINYSVERDIRFYGFRIKLNWEHLDRRVKIFRIFKARIKENILNKNYTISNLALERLTPVKSFPINNKILYDKHVFVRNEKVDFVDGSETVPFRDSGKTETYDYLETATIAANSNQVYEFIDKNIKFGETYSYIISGIANGFRETQKSAPITITVEDIVSPNKPVYFKAENIGSGILLTAVCDIDEDVVGFDLYRKRQDESESIYLDRIIKRDKSKQIVYFDELVSPGFEYEYKIFSVDFFENKSNEGLISNVIFDTNFTSKGNTPIPEITVKEDSQKILIEVIKNHKDIAGARIERQDVWRFEKGFSIKTNNGASWPGLIDFNEEGKITFIDISAKKDRIYRYKVSLFKKNSVQTSDYVTPNLKIEEGLFFSSNKKQEEIIKEKAKFNSFSIETINKKSNKPIIKLKWNINNHNWDYIFIRFDNGQELKIDNIHNEIYYDKLEKGKMYKIDAFLCDGDEIIQDSRRGAIIKL